MAKESGPRLAQGGGVRDGMRGGSQRSQRRVDLACTRRRPRRGPWEEPRTAITNSARRGSGWSPGLTGASTLPGPLALLSLPHALL